MLNKYLVLALGFLLVLSSPADAQNCATGSEITVSAGGSITMASTLRVYNSTEAGPDSSAARIAVDLQDDAWRSGVLSINPMSTFNTWTDTATSQGNAAVQITNAFTISGINVSYDYRDFPETFRTVAAPCTGSAIAAVGERVVFLAKTNTMQGSENAPRPASFYNTGNQPLVYDEIQASAQPGRASTINGAVFTFSSNIRAFGAWFGDTESRTDGSGNPMVARFLDSSGNRIGSDVLIEPMTTTQSGCGDTNVGCGNQTTRWIGFSDTVSTARIRQMVVITGYQGGGASNVGAQRLSFIGPTIPVGPTAASVSVGGRVTTAFGKPIANVNVMLQSGDGMENRYTFSSPLGYYNFAGVPVGQTYMLYVTGKRFHFADNIKFFTLFEDIYTADFASVE